MITYKFILFFFSFIVLNLLCIFFINKNWKNKKSIASLLMLLSLMFITLICFFPFPTDTRLLADLTAANQGLSNNYIPFNTIYTCISDAITYKMISIIIYQILGNVVLFIPLGISLFLYFDEKKLLKSIIIISITTLSIEGFQFMFNYLIQFNYRSVDIDDIILNILGGLIGYFIANCCLKLYLNFKHKKTKELG